MECIIRIILSWRLNRILFLYVFWPSSLWASPPEPPPSVPIHEPAVVKMDALSLHFLPPNSGFPIILDLNTQPSSSDGHIHIMDAELSYRGQSIHIAQSMFSDILTPALLDVSATTFSTHTGKVFVVFYIPDCSTHPTQQTCALVEFDWAVRGDVTRVDHR